MTNPEDNPDALSRKHKRAATPAKSAMSKSMHDGVEVWCDCCSCEAEPYWLEAMQEYDQQDSLKEDKT